MLLVCLACGYAANAEVAVAAKGTSSPTAEGEPLRDLYTPGAMTIAALAQAAGVAPERTLKAVFYLGTLGHDRRERDPGGGGDLVLALIRGDLDVNEVKLRNLLGCELRSLSHDEAAERGLVVGYAGPVELTVRGPLLLVADDSVVEAGGLVAGANRADYHLAGVTYGRNYRADLVGDIALARAGDACARCGAALEERRGIEAANTFKLGTRYSTTMGATYANEAGRGGNPLIMGCYGLGITRALACIVERHHDRDGIVWPASVAPYRVHLLVAGREPEAVAVAEELYGLLGADSTLYDDREASAGVKLKDADLLGMPVRLTVSARSLVAGGAELRLRRLAILTSRLAFEWAGRGPGKRARCGLARAVDLGAQARDFGIDLDQGLRSRRLGGDFGGR
jgi:prolyl-tRNA synthetase